MKASYEVLQPVQGLSFLVRTFGPAAFEAPYHFHAEYELTCIVNGNGKRFAGSHMGNFGPGDLVLIGPNLPHCWKLDNSEPNRDKASAIVIQFDNGFLGNDFFEKVEMQAIKKLLHLSAGGISFQGRTQKAVNVCLGSLSEEQDPFKILVKLLESLQRLATSAEYILLDQTHKLAERTPAEQARINPVLAYLVDNFRQQVSLDVAANIANMTTNAFCKYFKKVTRKTFVETIIEYRLNYATQQLVQTDKPIADIAYQSGFGDVSHFYKTFKLRMELSPLNYRKKFRFGLDEDREVA